MKSSLIEAGFEVRDGLLRSPYFEHIRDQSEEIHRQNSERARKTANARCQQIRNYYDWTAARIADEFINNLNFFGYLFPKF